MTDLGTILDNFSDILVRLPALLVGLAVVGILWGLVKYIFQADDKNAQEAARRIMIGGIIALFVMVSVWGFVQFLNNVFFTGTAIDPTAPPGGFPTLPTDPGGIRGPAPACQGADRNACDAGGQPAGCTC